MRPFGRPHTISYYNYGLLCLYLALIRKYYHLFPKTYICHVTLNTPLLEVHICVMLCSFCIIVRCLMCACVCVWVCACGFSCWYFSLPEMVNKVEYARYHTCDINQHTKFEVPIASPIPKIWIRGQSVIPRLALDIIYLHHTTIASAVPEIWLRASKLTMGLTLTTPLLGVVCYP